MGEMACVPLDLPNTPPNANSSWHGKSHLVSGNTEEESANDHEPIGEVVGQMVWHPHDSVHKIMVVLLLLDLIEFIIETLDVGVHFDHLDVLNDLI
jgi:hypothetical protein